MNGGLKMLSIDFVALYKGCFDPFNVEKRCYKAKKRGWRVCWSWMGMLDTYFEMGY